MTEVEVEKRGTNPQGDDAAWRSKRCAKLIVECAEACGKPTAKESDEGR